MTGVVVEFLCDLEELDAGDDDSVQNSALLEAHSDDLFWPFPV